MTQSLVFLCVTNAKDLLVVGGISQELHVTNAPKELTVDMISTYIGKNKTDSAYDALDSTISGMPIPTFPTTVYNNLSQPQNAVNTPITNQSGLTILLCHNCAKTT